MPTSKISTIGSALIQPAAINASLKSAPAPASASPAFVYKTVAAKPLASVVQAPIKFLSSDAFFSDRPAEVTFAIGNSNPLMTLAKAYSKSFELAADTGFKQLSGTSANTVSESISLKKGVVYSVNSAFGLSNSKGSVKLEVKDANNTVLKSIAGAAGKTGIASTFTPTADGVYTLSLTGQSIAKTTTTPASTTNIYGGYQLQISQPLSKLPTKSGNPNVDALVLGGTNAWHHEVGSAAAASTAVIDDPLKSLTNVVGNNKTIAYSFIDAPFISKLKGADANGAAAMDAATKAAVVTAFDYLSSLINVKFAESTDTSAATIVFGVNTQNASAGYANPPNQSGDHQQYLFLAKNAATNDSTKNNGFATGTYGWLTLVHEIAHTMGLKHPFNGNAGGGGTPGPYLPTETNNHRYSVMSYSSAYDSKALTTTVNGSSVSINPQQINPSTFMTYDIAALQYLYGANIDTQSTDSKLSSIQKLEFTDEYKGMQTIWTPNGGTLNAASTTRKNIIDLRGGAYSTINYLGTGATQVTKSLNASGINNSKTVGSVLSAFSSTTAAAYTGNNNVALAFGSRITEAVGGTADDYFYVSNYSSKLVGGAGTDTVYLSGKATDWTVSDNSKLGTQGGTLSAGAITLSNKTTKAAITLNGVEKYSFYAASASTIKA